MKFAAPRGHQPPMGPLPPETLQTSIFLFSSLYTSIVTKNKFFTFPAKLTHPGSCSIQLSFSMNTNWFIARSIAYIKNNFLQFELWKRKTFKNLKKY